jgi:hypothetical protein
MSSEVTAIVNIHKRAYVLDEQIQAIKNQSIAPKCIIIWNNGNKAVDLKKYKDDPYYKVFDCNYNTGVWPRFIIGLLADTEYLCVFDDDTIPGSNWFLNCINSMKEKEALYGTIGVVFKDSVMYDIYRRYGWDSYNNGNNNTSVPVDIVGHSWFFKKDWLSYLLTEPPKVNEYFTVGEDMTMSYMLRKYGNIPTYVPPHPSNNTSLFGSLPSTSFKYGCDGNGSCNVGCTFDDVLKELYAKGFTTLIKRQQATSVGDLDYFLNKIKNKENFALIRPADGEHYILQNKTLTNIDNWTFISNGKLYHDLTNSIHLASNKNCYVGIPCGHCNLNMGKWYISTFKLNPLYTTFANIFVNKNWKTWINFLKEERQPFIYVGPNSLPSEFLVEKYINIPLYLVNEWDSKGDEYLSKILIELKKYRNKLILLSGGPIAKIIIANLWNQHPYNIYLDVGSSLDLFSKGSTNRDYAIDGSDSSRTECKFDEKLITL